MAEYIYQNSHTWHACREIKRGNKRMQQVGDWFISARIRALTMQTLFQSQRQLITYYLWYFADVAAYLLKKEIEKIRLQVLFRL